MRLELSFVCMNERLQSCDRNGMRPLNHSPDGLLTRIGVSDANLPCATCLKSFAFAQKTYPNSAPTEPDCTYDDPEEVALGTSGKISRLEAKIGELLSKRHVC